MSEMLVSGVRMSCAIAAANWPSAASRRASSSSSTTCGALDRERDARREIAGDEIGVAIDRAAFEQERADERRSRAERGHDEASGQLRRAVAALRLAVARASSARPGGSCGGGLPRDVRAVGDRRDPRVECLGDRARSGSAGSGSPCTPSRRARRSSRPASTFASTRGYIARAERGERERHERRADEQRALQRAGLGPAQHREHRCRRRRARRPSRSSRP